MSPELATVPPRNVIVAESEPESVLAAVSLARRLAGGADLVFLRRDETRLLFTMPSHKNRAQPYRLLFVGLDGLPASDAALLAKDPAVSVHWLDANEHDDAGAAAVRALVRGGGTWHNVPRSHHAFDAIDAAAGDLGLADDAFAAKLRALAESRLPSEEDEAWGRDWRNALAALASRPLELISGVKPLVHGMPREIGDYEQIEGAALAGEIAALMDGSTLIKLPLRIGQTVLLIAPGPHGVHAGALADEAMRRTGAEVALSMFDHGSFALVRGRRRGADAPVSVTTVAELVRELPWIRPERRQPGSVLLRFVMPPKDAAQALVAALGRV